MKFLLKENEDIIGGVRFLGTQEENRKLERINSNIMPSQYNIMEIDI